MKKYLFFAAVVVFAMTACNKELESSVEFEAAPQEIAMRAFTGVNLPTKSAIDGTTFPAGYDMLVSAYRNLDADHKGTDAAKDYFEGIHFKKDATTGTWKEGKYWPLTGTLDFLAIACAGLNTAANGIKPICAWGESSNVAKKVVVTVPDNSEKFDDLLYGSLNGQKYVSTGNPISFNHAMAAVVFTAKSNVTYDATKNVGITINKISVDSVKFSGTLTVSNPAAGGGTGSLSATWSNYGNKKDNVLARVWDSTSVNRGINPSEAALNDLNLLYSKSKADSLSTFPFGEAYVILPGDQPATKFTVTYTIHNGFKSDGSTPLDNQLQYQYSVASGNWEQGKKYIYDINITLNEITISPLIVDWTDQTAVDVPIKQQEAN